MKRNFKRRNSMKKNSKILRKHYYINSILIKQKTVDKFIINTKKQMKILKYFLQKNN